MEELLIGGLALVVASVVLVMPIMGWVTARTARRENAELRQELVLLRRRVAGLHQQVLRQAEQPAAASVVADRAPDEAPAAGLAAAPFAAAPVASAEPEPPPASPLAPPVEAPADSPLSPLVADPAAPDLRKAAQPTPPPAATARHDSPPARAPRNVEEAIGLTWATRLGGVLLLLGVVYFFRYVVKQGWLGPVGRVTLGAVVGVGLIALAERLRTRTQPLWVHAILGIGAAILLASAWASHAMYGLIGPTTAFLTFAALVFASGALAVRHHSQPLLVTALAAGLANPVLLSTGADRPLALFAYTLLICAPALWLAAPRAWRWVAAVAALGGAALFTGWYDAWFGTPAYAALPARALPAAFVLVFAGLLAATALRFPGRFSAFLHVLSAVTSHAGSALLLPDHPQLLGAIQVALALAYGLLFLRIGRPELLAAPLIAGFAVQLGQVDTTAPLPAVALASLWLVVYGAMLSRPLAEPTDLAGRRRAESLLAMASLLFAGLAVLLLWPAHPTELLVVFVGLGASAVGLSAAGMGESFPLAASLLTGVTLIALLTLQPALTPIPLWLQALWAAIYTAGGAFVAWRKPPTPAGLALLTLPAALFAGLLLATTPPDATTARTVSLLTAAAVYAVLAGALHRRPRPRAAMASALAATALIALSIPVALDGPAVTALWAAMAAATAFAAGRAHSTRAAHAAFALLALALLHLLTEDLEAARQARYYFLGSEGTDGFFHAAPFLNPRSVGLFATGAASLLLARGLRPLPDPTAQLARAAMALGHLLLLGALVTEAWLTIDRGVPTPVAGPAFAETSQAALAALLDLAPTRALLTTLITAAYAALLLSGGFIRRDVTLRWLGLALLALTLAKLLLADIWSLSRVYQTLILIVVGALLLSSGFLYARFGDRLRGIVTPDDPPAEESD